MSWTDVINLFITGAGVLIAGIALWKSHKASRKSEEAEKDVAELRTKMIEKLDLETRTNVEVIIKFSGPYKDWPVIFVNNKSLFEVEVVALTIHVDDSGEKIPGSPIHWGECHKEKRVIPPKGGSNFEIPDVLGKKFINKILPNYPNVKISAEVRLSNEDRFTSKKYLHPDKLDPLRRRR